MRTRLLFNSLVIILPSILVAAVLLSLLQSATAETWLSPSHVRSTKGAILLSGSNGSAANAAQTFVLTGAANRRVCVGMIALYSSPAGSATLAIQSPDASRNLDFGTVATTTEAKVFSLGNNGFCGKTGENVEILVGAGGVGVVTKVSASADRQ